MLDHKQCTRTNVQKIGNAMRFIRNTYSESADAISAKMGYVNASAYCKLERGEKKTLCIEKILLFCEHFNISIVNLLLISEVENFKNKINTWSEFYTALENLPNDIATKLLELVPPPPPLQNQISKCLSLKKMLNNYFLSHLIYHGKLLMCNLK